MTAPVKVNGTPRVDLLKVREPRPVSAPAPAPAKSSTWRKSAWRASKSSAVFTARHGLYLAGGTRVVWRRTWEARTPARYERMIRTAEAAGNTELAQEWEERANRFREQRHRRRMDMLRAPQQIATSVKNGSMAVVGVMLAGGILLAVAEEDPGQVLAPWRAVADLVRLVATIAAVVWDVRYLLIVAGMMSVLGALWNIGRTRQTAPTWALPAAERRAEEDPITPHKVVLALRHLGITALKKAILGMEDHGAAMLSPIVLAGCGVEVDVTLPLEVSTKEIQAKHDKLAENLGRHQHELHISIPKAARTVRLWIADSGALDEPIGPSPLVTEPDITADYKSGRAPWGLDLRGDAAAVALYQRMVLVTGASNQGKTAALRALALWLAFDPTVEFRIADLKGVGDWTMFDGIATVLIEGPTDDHCISATEMLEEGVTEMNRRLLAPPGTKWKPLILIVDESQKAFMCPAKDEQNRPYGGKKATSRYFRAAREIHNQGRAVDVLLWQGTQDPTDENLPKLVRSGAHLRASVALSSEAQSEMALGDQAVAGGAAPHLLRQGIDKGQLVAAGDLGGLLKPGRASINIRTHYIDTEAAGEVADRIKERRSGIATRSAAAQAEPVDHLADIVAVVGPLRRVLTMDVLHGLKERNRAAYGDWTLQDLTRVLTAAGAEPYKSDGRMVVGRDRVLRALDERREAADGEGVLPDDLPDPPPST